jgi:carboxylesterase type B
MSEDCLYINIWVPDGAHASFSKKRSDSNFHVESAVVQGDTPVMVWIHGGAYQVGGATSPIYPGEELARRTGNIVVVIQYRLGPLGFLITPGMQAEDRRGNHGLLDQQLALRFINQYIGYFGGNTSAVCIFGESAGGGSVAWHLTNEGSWPFFTRAIAQSPGAQLYPSLKASLAVGQQVSRRVGCSQTDPAEQMKCLRGLPAASFADKIWDTPLGAIPSIDDFYTLHSPTILFAQGKSRPNTPVIVGSNEQEGNFFMWTTAFNTKATWPSIVALEWVYLTPFYNTAEIQQVQSFYNQYWNSPSTYFHGGSEMVGDVLIDCAVVFMSNFLSMSNSSSPVYRYLFTHKPQDWLFGKLNSTHLAEVPFVFNTAEFMGMRFTPEEIPLTNSMSDMWGRFTRYGSPTANSADWPPYDGHTQYPIRVFDLHPPQKFTSRWKYDICQKYLPFILQ